MPQIDRIEAKVDGLQEEMVQVKTRLTAVETWRADREGRKTEIREAMVEALREVFSLKRIGMIVTIMLGAMSLIQQVFGWLQ